MSDATSSLPSRNLSAMSSLSTVFTMQLRQLLVATRTRVLFVVQMLPVLGVLAYVIFENVDGLTMFSSIVEQVIVPFLAPLAAIFFGGPAIVDEMEGRTLTYLTLRPVGKGTLFVGKLLAGICVAVGVVLIPLLLLFAISLWQSGDMSASFASLGYIVAGVTSATATYVAIFAALGAAFASSLMASIIYFVVFEFVLGLFPVLEMASIGYWTRMAASLPQAPGWLDELVLDKPLSFDWWIGLLVIVVVGLVATAIGSYIFRERQYVV